LRDLIKLRLDDENLIEEKAYLKIIKNSGGNIRQLIEIVYQSAIHQLQISKFNGTQIDCDDVEWGVAQISSRLSKVADSNIKILKQIYTHHKLFEEPTSQENDSFDNLLLNNLIFLHKNGTHWYDINPIIKKTVIAHGKSNKKSDD
jgi:hypothetical protein